MGSGDVVGGMVQKRGLQVHCLGSGRINIKICCTEFVDCYFCINFLTKWFSMICFISTSTSGKILPL